MPNKSYRSYAFISPCTLYLINFCRPSLSPSHSLSPPLCIFQKCSIQTINRNVFIQFFFIPSSQAQWCSCITFPFMETPHPLAPSFTNYLRFKLMIHFTFSSCLTAKNTSCQPAPRFRAPRVQLFSAFGVFFYLLFLFPAHSGRIFFFISFVSSLSFRICALDVVALLLFVL